MPAKQKKSYPAKTTVERPKKKNWFLRIIFGVFIFVVLGRTLSFYGFPLFDVIHYLRPTMSDEQIGFLINPISPKGYQYPKPSSLAEDRVVNCNDLYFMYEFPRNNPLCRNLFQTSTEELTQALAAGSYDRIVLYGERSVFDAPTSSGVTDNYIHDLFETVKFMDLIAIPKFLSAYGLTDVNYIKATKPYPYLYYRISSLDDSDMVCDNNNSTEKIQGCARSYYASIIPLYAVGPQLSDARPVLRKTDNKRFSYLTHYPADCFTNSTFAHETAHLLNDAGEGMNGKYVMDSWFNEQVAGFFSIYGADLACGDGTVTQQSNKKNKDVPKTLVEFNRTFAPAALSHSYPEDNTCRQAILTEWYAYLGKGNYRNNFKRFFQKQRAEFDSIVSDKDLIELLLSLSPSSRKLLISKGCLL